MVWSFLVLAPVGATQMSLLVNHVLLVQLVVMESRLHVLDLLGVIETPLFVSYVLVGIHAAVVWDRSVSLEAFPWMVKVAVQCVLQDCTLIVQDKLNARTVKWDTSVLGESRVHVLKEPMLLPRNQPLVLHLPLDIMYLTLVPPIRLYV